MYDLDQVFRIGYGRAAGASWVDVGEPPGAVECGRRLGEAGQVECAEVARHLRPFALPMRTCSRCRLAEVVEQGPLQGREQASERASIYDQGVRGAVLAHMAQW